MGRDLVGHEVFAVDATIAREARPVRRVIVVGPDDLVTRRHLIQWIGLEGITSGCLIDVDAPGEGHVVSGRRSGYGGEASGLRGLSALLCRREKFAWTNYCERLFSSNQAFCRRRGSWCRGNAVK